MRNIFLQKAVSTSVAKVHPSCRRVEPASCLDFGNEYSGRGKVSGRRDFKIAEGRQLQFHGKAIKWPGITMLFVSVNHLRMNKEAAEI